MLAKIGGIIILYKLIPDDFIIVTSLFWLRFPNAINVETNDAIGTTRTTIHERL